VLNGTFSVSESSSSSSSDDSDSESDGKSEEDALENRSAESNVAENEFVEFDENVKPEDLEQELYELAFVLRSKRHGLEQSILKTKSELEQSNKKLANTYEEMDVTNKKLEQETAELKTYQVRDYTQYYANLCIIRYISVVIA
jgi:dynactin complex subunit